MKLKMLALFLAGAYIMAVAIYDITSNDSKAAMVTNALMVAAGGGIMYYAYSK